MPGATDAMLVRLQGELDERERFIDNVVEGAQNDSRDLTEQEMTLLGRTRDRITEIRSQLDPLQETARIATESRRRTHELADQLRVARDPDAPGPVEYRSAGAYVIDRWRAGLGAQDAMERMDLYHRAAAHQTTADNPGLIPEPMVGPIVTFIDAARPLVNALGPRQLPSGSWSRPRITQHTNVDAQSAEKAELVSRKMLISSTPVTAVTYGGYVNVSRQNIDWSQPSIMDLVINDLAAQYALETELAAATEFVAEGTSMPALPTGTPDADDVVGAFWGAAAAVMAATAGQGRVFAVVPPELMGMIGPLFPPVNPQNASSSGFSTAALASGLAGNVAGIPVIVSGAMPADTILVLSSAAAEVYEDRIGSLQVVEPSVLGVQVAYAGYFAPLALEPTGIAVITKTP